MSITFTAELTDPDAYVIACCEPAAERQRRLGTYDQAVDALRDFELLHMANGHQSRPVLPGCAVPTECPDYAWHVIPVHDDPAPTVNVHQADAKFVLDALGYPVPHGDVVDLAGKVDGLDFAGRVLTALALAPVDAGMPAYEDTQPGCVRWHVGSRPAGYLQDTLVRLDGVARWCRVRGRRVQWA